MVELWVELTCPIESMSRYWLSCRKLPDLSMLTRRLSFRGARRRADLSKQNSSTAFSQQNFTLLITFRVVELQEAAGIIKADAFGSP